MIALLYKYSFLTRCVSRLKRLLKVGTILLQSPRFLFCIIMYNHDVHILFRVQLFKTLLWEKMFNYFIFFQIILNYFSFLLFTLLRKQWVQTRLVFFLK